MRPVKIYYHDILGMHKKRLLNKIRDEAKICAHCKRVFPNSEEPRDDPLLFKTLDHIIPKYRGGTDKLENLQVLCRRCHDKKDNKHGRVRPM